MSSESDRAVAEFRRRLEEGRPKQPRWPRIRFWLVETLFVEWVLPVLVVAFNLACLIALAAIAVAAGVLIAHSILEP